MRLAIIGDGLLGRTLLETARATLEFDRETGKGDYAFMLSHADVDILSESSIRAAVNLHRPTVAINTVAFHRLAECEREPQRAYDVNARGAGRLAKLVPTVYISTDYVFWDGGPHDESMPGPRPRSVYGQSKLAGELETLGERGIVVRVAGLYGHYDSHKGPSFPQTVLSAHSPMKLPTDQTFSPTYAPDAAGRIIDLALSLGKGKADGIYHATNRGNTTWAAFAEYILTYTRHERHVLPYRARDDIRPPNSALVSRRLPQLPHWIDGLGRWAQREQHYQVVSPKRDA